MINFVSLILFQFLWAKDLAYEVRELRFSNGSTLKVEMADDFRKRTIGLMHRTQMNEDAGMLFVFDQATRQSFWNKNTFIAPS